MSRPRTIALFAVIAIPLSAVGHVASGQDLEQASLQGKHRIEIVMGLMTDASASTEVSTDGVTTQSDATGVVGCLAYTYHFHRDFGLNISAGVFDADATISTGTFGSHVESATVIPLLFGLKFQPQTLAIGSAIRPYASASMGPYIGSVSDVQAGLTTSTEAFTETTFGSRIGLGMDFLLGRLFTLGVGGSYHFVADFDRRIGSETNYSGPEFSLAVGIGFGG